jgi:hypothetical protein
MVSQVAEQSQRDAGMQLEVRQSLYLNAFSGQRKGPIVTAVVILLCF